MMTKAERKIARKNLLDRLEPIDPELAEEVREMWQEEEEAKKKGAAGRASAKYAAAVVRSAA